MNDAVLTAQSDDANDRATAVSAVRNVPLGNVCRPAMSLRENFAWSVVGNISYAACLFGITVALAKLSDPATVGRFSLAMRIAGPIFVFAGLNTRQLHASDPAREFTFGDYFGLRFAMVAFALALTCGIAVFTEYAATIGVVLALVGVAKSFESLAEVFYGELQRSERMRPIALSMTLKGILSLAAFSVGLAASGLELATLGLALAWLAVLLGYDWPTARANHGDRLDRPSWDFERLSRLFLQTLPLGIAIFLVALTASVPPFFIEPERGFAELGVFSALAYLMLPGTLIVNALGQSATSRLAWSFANDRRAFLVLFAKMLTLALGLGAAGVLVAIVLGRPVLALVYRPEYAEHVDLLAWLMVAAGVGYVGSMFGYALTAARILHGQAILFAFVCAATALGCWLWVGPFGLIGAAWGLLFAAAVQLVGSVTLFVLGLHTRGVR
jgi:O-antigen/teichoic acid export membrane protein